MKIIFTKTSEIKKVSFGYAVNYLIPQGLAVKATKLAIKQLESKKLREEKTKTEKEKENIRLARKFEGETIKIRSKTGKKGKLFGAITKKQLAKKLQIGKETINLSGTIKKIGEYEIELQFGKQKTKVKLKIEKELSFVEATDGKVEE